MAKKRKYGSGTVRKRSDGRWEARVVIGYDDNGNPMVWADNGGKLEKRPVNLGEYNMMNDTFEILSGLTEEDYIAFPDYELCVEGAPTTKVEPAQMDTTQDVELEGVSMESVVLG